MPTSKIFENEQPLVNVNGESNTNATHGKEIEAIRNLTPEQLVELIAKLSPEDKARLDERLFNPRRHKWPF